MFIEDVAPFVQHESRANPFWYFIDTSALFNGVDSRLIKTGNSAGDATQWTVSFWIKPCSTTDRRQIFTSILNTEGYPNTGIWHTADMRIGVDEWSGTATEWVFQSGGNLLADTTAWHHMVIAYDSTLTDEAARVKVWKNGLRIIPTEYTPPNLNHISDIGKGWDWLIGGLYDGRFDLDSYLSELHLINGQALTPVDFGSFSNAVSGLWTPKRYTGAYGTNGFHLDFSDSTQLGRDTSGNGHHFTCGGSPLQTSDTPTNNGLTWDRFNMTGAILTKGNRHASCGGVSPYARIYGTLPLTKGKYCFGIKCLAATDGNGSFGVRSTNSNWVSVESPEVGYAQFLGNESTLLSSEGNKTVSPLVYGGTYVVAVNLEENTCAFYRGTDIVGTVNLKPGLSYLPFAMTHNSQHMAHFELIRSELYTAPTGFAKLCANSLPTAQIMRSSKVVDVVSRIGTGQKALVSGLEFQPDFVSVKRRNEVGNWYITDSVRGANKQLILNQQGAQLTDNNIVTSLNHDGYSLGVSPTYAVNGLGDSFLDWCMASGRRQGFDIVTYTGDGVAGKQIAHSLGKAPTFMLIKNVHTGGPDWAIYHKNLGATQYLKFASKAAVTSPAGWNNSEPTSTHFTVGTGTSVNSLGDEYVAYLFTDSDIFKTFSYTGNGSVDGPYIPLGGKPLFLTIKTAVAQWGWLTHDTKRNPFNAVDDYLVLNENSAEVPNYALDNHLFTAHGFKVHGTGLTTNVSGARYVGFAILESTAKYNNAF